jgi:hypothetical protein
MSSEPVEALGQLSASREWRKKAPDSAGAFRTATVEIKTAPFRPDSTQLSPLAQLVGTLETLKDSDPPKYTQVTRQIAKNLLAAGRIAGSRGDPSAATELDQLAKDFAAASEGGQLQTLFTQAAHAGHAASASGIRSGGSTETKFLAFLRTNESHSAQNAALDDAAVYVRIVSTEVKGFDENLADFEH